MSMGHFWSMSPCRLRRILKNMPSSEVLKSKRAFVSVLRSVGEAVGLNVTCKRESSDKAVLDVYRRLAKVVHPDKATGNLVYQQQLNNAKQRWEDTRKAAKGKGSVKPSAPQSLPASSGEALRSEYRMQGESVLLTYHAASKGLPGAGGAQGSKKATHPDSRSKSNLVVENPCFEGIFD